MGSLGAGSQPAAHVDPCAALRRAAGFYQRAVGEHLQIGLETVNLLRSELASLHSRKLRSFDEPPFR